MEAPKCDTDWLKDALSSLYQNTWTAPIHVVGFQWPCLQREAAAVALWRALATNTSVTALCVQHAALDVEKRQVLAETFSKNSTLRSVNLVNLSQENGERYTVPAVLFESSSAGSLNTVSLKQVRLDEEACRAIASNLGRPHSIRHLCLNDVEIDSAGRAVLFAALGMTQTLASLTLRYIDLDDQDLRHLSLVLGLNQSIQTLHVEGMRNGGQVACALGHVLSRNSTLQELSIRENKIGPSDFAKLCEQGLTHNQSLRTLFASKNPIGWEGTRSIMQVLEETSSNLERLCLAFTGLGEKGCRAVAQSIPRCKRPLHLNLDGNPVEACVAEFLVCLENSYHIVHLFDRLPKILAKPNPCASWQQVDILLRANRHHRRYLCQQANEMDRFTSSLLSTVLASASADHNVMYLLLQTVDLSSQMRRRDSPFVDSPR